MINHPYTLILDEENDDEFVVKASCGKYHNLLLTNKNNIYSFGWNYYNQCTISQQEFILKPYLLCKEKELGLVYDNYLYHPCDVLAYYHNSIIFIDPCTAKKL